MARLASFKGSSCALAEELDSQGPLRHTESFSGAQPLGSLGKTSRNPGDTGNLSLFHPQGNFGTRRWFNPYREIGAVKPVAGAPPHMITNYSALFNLVTV